MLALDRAIVARFKETTFSPLISKLCDTVVPAGTPKPYAVFTKLDVGGPIYTFKDQDGTILTIEPYSVQFTIIAIGKANAESLLQQLDGAFNCKPLTVSGIAVTPIRSSPLITFDTEKQDSAGKSIYQGVARYRMDYDFTFSTN